MALDECDREPYRPGAEEEQQEETTTNEQGGLGVQVRPGQVAGRPVREETQAPPAPLSAAPDGAPHCAPAPIVPAPGAAWAASPFFPPYCRNPPGQLHIKAGSESTHSSRPAPHRYSTRSTMKTQWALLGAQHWLPARTFTRQILPGHEFTHLSAVGTMAGTLPWEEAYGSG